MLSIGAMKGGDGRYYLDLAQEDYYLEGGEPPGRWWGSGAEKLGLTGKVQRDQLENLLAGFSPSGDALTQNAGRVRRQSGWDLTFSAPKSVSVLWSQADARTRREIQNAHFNAVNDALAYLESDASFTRRGKGGSSREPAGLVVATFEHGTSRAQDPQLHTHCLVQNVATREDGTTGSLLSRPLYRHKMAAGAFYRAALASRLEQGLGLRCEAKGTWFELAGVPNSLCTYFSKRRADIKDKLGSLGLETASAAAFAALSTRKPKNLVVARKELFREWQKVGRQFDFGRAEAKALLNDAKVRDKEKSYRSALKNAVDYITERESHFSKKELIRRTMEASLGTGLDAKYVLSRVEHDLFRSRGLVRLGERAFETHYTTPAVMKTEAKLLEIAERSRADTMHVVRSDRVDAAIAKCRAERSAFAEEAKYHAKQLWRAAAGKKTERIDRKALRAAAQRTLHLNDEQVAAARYITETPGSIKVLRGLAGTGKTSILGVCREAWEMAGYEVVGAALSGKAKSELQAGSGIESYTLKMLEMKMAPSTGYQIKHHARQIWNVARKKGTHKLERLKINKGTVLVIDEAGMVGTKQLTRVIEMVDKQGGKVVLVGDDKQLQALQAGGPFRGLAERLGCAELREIGRQYDERDKQVVRDLVAGEAESALQNLAERGLVSVSETREQAIEKLVSDWSKDDASRTREALIFCGTNREADEVNRRCQLDRTMKGDVDSSRRVQANGAHLCNGDRVLFTKNDRTLGVYNGDLGTVVAVNQLRKRVSVRLDSGKRAIVPLKQYKHKRGDRKGEMALRLGYAVTTHKGQGSTVLKAYVLAGARMQDKEISYVQASRARRETRVYTDEREAGKDLSGLARKMSTSRSKELAHDVARQREQERSRQRNR